MMRSPQAAGSVLSEVNCMSAGGYTLAKQPLLTGTGRTTCPLLRGMGSHSGQVIGIRLMWSAHCRSPGAYGCLSYKQRRCHGSCEHEACYVVLVCCDAQAFCAACSCV